MGGYPLCGVPGSALDDPPGKVWETGLPSDFIRDAVRSVAGCLLSQAIYELIANRPLASRTHRTVNSLSLAARRRVPTSIIAWPAAGPAPGHRLSLAE